VDLGFKKTEPQELLYPPKEGDGQTSMRSQGLCTS
jgi:hypothetical protein